MVKTTPSPTSHSLPFIPRPDYCDGTLAADVGFDPLGLVTLPKPGWFPQQLWGAGGAEPARRLAWLREAEVKHARLAMLAAAGWPLAELWHGAASSATGLPFGLDLTEGRVPSVLNGNLGPSVPFLAAAAAFATYLELNSLDNSYGLTAAGKTMKPDGSVVVKSYTAGDLGWDPLKLYDVFGKQAPAMVEMRMENDPDYRLKWVEFNRQEMAKAEIKNGRLAMLAIVSFAMQEALWKTPVVDQTPLFFTPIFKILFGAGQDGF